MVVERYLDSITVELREGLGNVGFKMKACARLFGEAWKWCCLLSIGGTFPVGVTACVVSQKAAICLASKLGRLEIFDWTTSRATHRSTAQFCWQQSGQHDDTLELTLCFPVGYCLVS
jgi:hypothetical protein